MDVSSRKGGDDLGDDFVLDDIVALSGEEDADNLVYFSDSGDKSQHVKVDAAQATEVDSSKLKKRKRREKEKERKIKKRKLLENVNSNSAEDLATSRPPAVLSDWISSMQAKTFKDLSIIEFEDIRIPESSLVDTTSWTGTRTLEQLIEFITEAVPALHVRLSQNSKANGSPTLLFVTGSALRVVDITRVLKDKRLRGDKGAEVGKLFAKHFKLSEHVAYLKRTKIGSAVGTPGRMGKLLCETDALSISALSHIILDISYKDAKNRTLLDIPETRDELFKTVIGAPQVLKVLKEGKVKLVLF
ncbi:U3-containing 90S pre-ribosomal complex subunit-domain containing protein [Cyathus striatus]|nr:U3-containing 90S pre-ribosomal complex subunit-domain containing protein [Cyathus striatus]